MDENIADDASYELEPIDNRSKNRYNFSLCESSFIIEKHPSKLKLNNNNRYTKGKETQFLVLVTKRERLLVRFKSADMSS